MQPSVESFIGKKLDKFQIVQMTELFETDDDGRFAKSIGLFGDASLAEAYAENESHRDTKPVIVLTDGLVSYIVPKQDSVHVFDQDVVRKELKEKAFAALSPAMKKALGIPE